jgi:hypothetical protein
MPQLDLSAWGYPSSSPKRYKCRVHGVVNNSVRIEVHNVDYELVFDRRYCSICLDKWFQQNLEPMVEVDKKDIKNEFTY